MNHAGPSGDCVRGGARGCADDQTVALHAGHVLAVDEEVDIREIRGRAAINHDLVQHQKIRRRFGRFALLSFPHDDTSQPTPQGQGRVT